MIERMFERIAAARRITWEEYEGLPLYDYGSPYSRPSIVLPGQRMVTEDGSLAANILGRVFILTPVFRVKAISRRRAA